MWSLPNKPEVFDCWYFRVIVNKERVVKCADTPDFASAVALGKALLESMQGAKLVGRLEQFREFLAGRLTVTGAPVAREVVTLGDFLRAFEAVAVARGLKEWQRGRNSARLVAAVACGIMEPLSSRRMDTDGGRLIREVEALPVEKAICERTAMEYARKMQGGEVINLDKNLPPEINGVINSTLGNARVMLSRQNRIMDVAGLAVDWEALDGFMRLTLPVAGKDVGASIPTRPQYDAMMADWRRLHGSGDGLERELALCNELLRLLGLRSGELVMARESWLYENEAGKCFLWVKNRTEERWSCKSGNAAKLPLAAELAERLRARCAEARAAGMVNPFLILPLVPGDETLGKEQRDRLALVRDRHNAWLKGFIGEVSSGQGNHRLRKWCATRIFKLEMDAHGDEIRAGNEVKNYLRHSKAATSFVHYISRNDELLRTVTDE